MTNSFVLRTDLDRERCLKAVNAAPLDPPTAVEIAPYSKKRSRPQVNRHWAMMRQIEEQLCDEKGQKHDAEAWHIHCCGEFLGCDIITMGGVDRLVPRPSPKDSRLMAEFTDQCEAWAAGRGVTLVFDTDQF